MIALPETISPEDLAIKLGWSPRRLRQFATKLGACRILGNRMVLTHSDVVLILRATRPGVSLDEMRDWIGQDADELIAEDKAQGGRPATGVVYFLRRGNEIKIGYTNDLTKRLTQFRTATTEPFTVALTIPGTPALEAYFHEKFAGERLEREWFKAAGVIEEFIARRTHRS